MHKSKTVRIIKKFLPKQLSFLNKMNTIVLFVSHLIHKMVVTDREIIS